MNNSTLYSTLDKFRARIDAAKAKEAAQAKARADKFKAAVAAARQGKS